MQLNSRIIFQPSETGSCFAGPFYMARARNANTVLITYSKRQARELEVESSHWNNTHGRVRDFIVLKETHSIFCSRLVRYA
jgi:hypothetical protein